MVFYGLKVSIKFFGKILENYIKDIMDSIFHLTFYLMHAAPNCPFYHPEKRSMKFQIGNRGHWCITK